MPLSVLCNNGKSARCLVEEVLLQNIMSTFHEHVNTISPWILSEALSTLLAVVVVMQ
jgi:hypothetical protein